MAGAVKLPAMQFYVGDWMKDPNLRRCSHAAKGVWIDILCLMWESEERGVLVSSRRAWSDQEIALAVGGDSVTTLACLDELTVKGVAARRQDGALYSKRLVRDEHKRALCQEAGKRGGNPKLVGDNHSTLKGHSKGRPKGHAKGELTPSSSISSSSSITERESYVALSNLADGHMLPESWRGEETLEELRKYCKFFARNDIYGRPLDAIALNARLHKCGGWSADRLCRSLELTMEMMRTDKIFDADKKPPKKGASVQSSEQKPLLEDI